MSIDSDFHEHLKSVCTTTCRAWAVTRKDGVQLGFTDHDCDLEFDGIKFRADTGMTARAVQSSTGMAVDDSEAVGALNSAAISERDIEFGLYDDAEVRAWWLNWADTRQRQLAFSGTIGEIERSEGTFRAELRGLAERLNQPRGRVSQKGCLAKLGALECGVDLEQLGYNAEGVISSISGETSFSVSIDGTFENRWFERGALHVLSGEAAGAQVKIKSDRQVEGTDDRDLQIWSAARRRLRIGDSVKLYAGCDKRFDTCRIKYRNGANFQGFPDVPGDDWMVAVPTSSSTLSGGSRR